MERRGTSRFPRPRWEHCHSDTLRRSLSDMSQFSGCGPTRFSAKDGQGPCCLLPYEAPLGRRTAFLVCDFLSRWRKEQSAGQRQPRRLGPSATFARFRCCGVQPVALVTNHRASVLAARRPPQPRGRGSCWLFFFTAHCQRGGARSLDGETMAAHRSGHRATGALRHPVDVRAPRSRGSRSRAPSPHRGSVSAARRGHTVDLQGRSKRDLARGGKSQVWARARRGRTRGVTGLPPTSRAERWRCPAPTSEPRAGRLDWGRGGGAQGGGGQVGRGWQRQEGWRAVAGPTRSGCLGGVPAGQVRTRARPPAAVRYKRPHPLARGASVGQPTTDRRGAVNTRFE